MTSTGSIELFCVVDGESASSAFPVKLSTDDSIGALKDLIKTKKTPRFDDVAADELTLWRVSIPIADDDDEVSIQFNNVATEDKKKLGPATRLSKVFSGDLPEETIHILVRRPPPAQQPIPGVFLLYFAFTLFIGDQARPLTALFSFTCS